MKMETPVRQTNTPQMAWPEMDKEISSKPANTEEGNIQQLEDSALAEGADAVLRSLESNSGKTPNESSYAEQANSAGVSLTNHPSNTGDSRLSSQRTKGAYARHRTVGLAARRGARTATASTAADVLKMMKSNPKQAMVQAKKLMQTNPQEGAKLLKSLMDIKAPAAESLLQFCLKEIATNPDSFLQVVGTYVELFGAAVLGGKLQALGGIAAPFVMLFSAYKAISNGHNAIMKSHVEKGAYEALGMLAQGQTPNVEKMAQAYRNQITQGYPNDHLTKFKKDFDERTHAYKEGLQQAIKLQQGLVKQKKWGMASTLLQALAKQTSMKKAVKMVFKSVVEG